MDEDFWSYYPEFIENHQECFNELLILSDEICECRNVNMYGKEITTKRKSTFFYHTKELEYDYGGTKCHLWQESEIIQQLKEVIETELNQKFDYCLMHIYPDGNAPIAWHNDKDCLDSKIASISFGATRKFRFRRKGDKQGYTHQFLLNSGDLFVMNEGCQRRFEHCVPIEKGVIDPRINLTFRSFS